VTRPGRQLARTQPRSTTATPSGMPSRCLRARPFGERPSALNVIAGAPPRGCHTAATAVNARASIRRFRRSPVEPAATRHGAAAEPRASIRRFQRVAVESPARSGIQKRQATDRDRRAHLRPRCGPDPSGQNRQESGAGAAASGAGALGPGLSARVDQPVPPDRRAGGRPSAGDGGRGQTAALRAAAGPGTAGKGDRPALPRARGHPGPHRPAPAHPARLGQLRQSPPKAGPPRPAVGPGGAGLRGHRPRGVDRHRGGGGRQHLRPRGGGALDTPGHGADHRGGPGPGARPGPGLQRGRRGHRRAPPAAGAVAGPGAPWPRAWRTASTPAV
jgi:hypothetical protein